MITNSTRSFSGLGGDAPFEIDMEEEVRLSYESVKNVDILDVSSGRLKEQDSCQADSRRRIRDLEHSRDGLQRSSRSN